MKEILEEIREIIKGSELNGVAGSLIYSSVKTIKPGQIAFYGLNPGGVPDEKSTVLDHLNFMSREENNNFNEYCDGVWKPGGRVAPRGGATLQKRVQYLLASLAINARNVFASNLIFKRSRSESELKNEDYWAEICWPIHKRLLSIVDPSLIIVMGNFAFNFLKNNMDDIYNSEFFESGHGDWSCESVIGSLGNRTRKLVKIPHLSRYDITSHRSVIDKIKTIRDLKLSN